MLDVNIQSYSAPYFEIKTRELVKDKAAIDFAIKAIHINVQKQLAKIGGEPEW